MVTGDLVIDLAFEEAAVEASTDTAALPEGPDNAAEHVLMPSHKGDSLASVSPAAPSAALAVALASTWLPTQATRRAGPIYERPPRSSPVPFPLPLRIQTHIAGSPGLFRRHHDGTLVCFQWRFAMFSVFLRRHARLVFIHCLFTYARVIALVHATIAPTVTAQEPEREEAHFHH